MTVDEDPGCMHLHDRQSIGVFITSTDMGQPEFRLIHTIDDDGNVPIRAPPGLVPVLVEFEFLSANILPVHTFIDSGCLTNQSGELCIRNLVIATLATSALDST